MKKVFSLVSSMSLVASSLLAAPSIELTPSISEFVPKARIDVTAVINDSDATVDLVRTYFKAADSANYSFVDATCKASVCTSTLPAVSESTQSIDYLVLVKNSAGQVYKTQTFSAEALPVGTALPSYQVEPNADVIKVKTELAQAPETVEGFSDNIALDAVQDSLRFGTVAGIYAGTTSTTATSAGTVAATTSSTAAAGFSTTALVAGAVAVAAGGVAVSQSNSGGGDSYSSYYPTTELIPTEPTTTTYTLSDIAGTWIAPDSSTCSPTGTSTMVISADGTMTDSGIDCLGAYTDIGTVSVSGDTSTIHRFDERTSEERTVICTINNINSMSCSDGTNTGLVTRQ